MLLNFCCCLVYGFNFLNLDDASVRQYYYFKLENIQTKDYFLLKTAVEGEKNRWLFLRPAITLQVQTQINKTNKTNKTNSKQTDNQNKLKHKNSLKHKKNQHQTNKDILC